MMGLLGAAHGWGSWVAQGWGETKTAPSLKAATNILKDET